MSVANGTARKEMRSNVFEMPSLVSLTIGMCNGTADGNTSEFHLGRDVKEVYEHDLEHKIIIVNDIDPDKPSDEHHFALAIAIMEEHLDNKKLAFDKVSDKGIKFNRTIIQELINVKNNGYKLTYIIQPPYRDTDGKECRVYAPKKPRSEPYGFLCSLLSWLTYILVGFNDKTYAVMLILEAWHRLPSTDLINYLTDSSDSTKQIVPEYTAKITPYIERIEDSSQRSSMMNAFHFLSEWANKAFDLYLKEPDINWVFIENNYVNFVCIEDVVQCLKLFVSIEDGSDILIYNKDLTIKILMQLGKIQKLKLISQTRTSDRYELFTRTRIRTYRHIS